MPLLRIAWRPQLFLVLLLAPGCGGGGGGGSTPPPADPVTILITSTASLDGSVTTTDAYPSYPSGIAVGDLIANEAARATLRFSLAAVPAGATVLVATLSIDQVAVSGTPYATLGVLTVDHVLLGPSLDPSDYASAPLAAVGTLSSSATLTTKSLIVTAPVAADLAAARTDSDFRLRFTTDTDGDAGDDIAQFNDAENAVRTDVLPTLTVTYQP